MITYPLPSEMLTINAFKFNVGELVITVLGEYGVVVKVGQHDKYPTDRTDYYHVLIGDHIYCYLAFALIKVKKN
tara:strand:+ start:504 stop:725 length:222 start_codon:yes stop_codon:yes gene_type:complete